MTVKIVTDSLSDITGEIAQSLGITVVPLTVLFGHESFLDRVTITSDEFYKRLVAGSVMPTTTQPSVGAFSDVYEKLAAEADQLLVIVLSSRLSGTYQSATSARDLLKKKVRVEVIDSRTVAMGLGLVVIAAAKAAQSGMKLDELVSYVNHTLPRSHPVMYFDTLKYLAKGGRIGKAQGLLGSMLSIKPLLTVRDGEMAPLTRVRSMAAGIEYMYNFVAGFSRIEELAVEHTTNPDDADRLVDKLSGIFPREHIYRSTVSPVLGVYGGPNALAVSVLEAEKK